jgi:dynein heavy chain
VLSCTFNYITGRKNIIFCVGEVNEWYEKLTRMMKTVEEWGRVQARWLYLLPIFSSKDIMNQMPEEGKLFEVNYLI